MAGADETPPAAGGDALDVAEDRAGGVLVRLRVSAGASRTRVVGGHGGAMKLQVSAPPEKGKANREVLALVARTFGLPPSGVSLVKGETSQDKVVRLPLSRDETTARWGLYLEREGGAR